MEIFEIANWDLKEKAEEETVFALACTEHGVLMLSSVLSSERVVQVNIQIMRTYTS